MSLEISIQLFFFPFLFSSYYCSADPCVVSVVSARYNQSFFLLFMWSSRRLIDISTLSWMLVSPLPSSLLDTYSLSIIYLVCKALCIDMSLLVLCSICWSSSLVHFNNGPEHLTRETTQVFILLMRFLLYSLVSSSFLILLRYSF